MKTLNDYFERIFCINLKRRPDRWAHVEEQCKTFGFTVERFEAHDSHDCLYDGKVNGNFACTASHRGVLEIIAHEASGPCLVLEDDFEIVYPEFNEMLEAMMPEVPDGYDILYLGAHYGEDPIARVAPSVIRCGLMLTTSSYAISPEHAKRIAPYVSGVGPIDNIIGGFNKKSHAYVFHPRLMVQYENFSDLQDRVMANAPAMQDRHHEEMV